MTAHGRLFLNLAAKVVITLAEQLHDLQVRIGVLEKDLVAMNTGMSVMGQERTLAALNFMSALPPLTDIVRSELPDANSGATPVRPGARGGVAWGGM